MTGKNGLTRRRVLVLGGTGTIGRAVVAELVARDHQVVCVVRPRNQTGEARAQTPVDRCLDGAEVRVGDVTDPASLAAAFQDGEPFDALVSCLASRTGAPRDAWTIDYQAHVDALELAQSHSVKQMVLLSAICVQRPRLAFQHAKLAFEERLIGSGLTYSIVRPTAYFKSLSGQVARVQQGRPFLVFGDGTLTACKPISDADLASYMADCLEDASLQNRILPIGGPGPAITPRDQGEYLFDLLGREARFKQVPPALLSTIAAGLGVMGKVVPPLAAKAEFARIGHYYGTESMLVLNPETGRYDADATPETGSETLFDYYRRLVEGRESVDLGEHAVF
jgi:divinyl chlorophyllide a 8-vinyl-reductase